MEKQIITMADQELANRIEKRCHFLKDIEKIINWKRINKVLSKVEIRRSSVATESAERKSLCRNPPVAARYIICDKELDCDLYDENNATAYFALHRF